MTLKTAYTCRLCIDQNLKHCAVSLRQHGFLVKLEMLQYQHLIRLFYKFFVERRRDMACCLQFYKKIATGLHGFHRRHEEKY